MVALKTFYNLSEDRRNEIISVCLEEFALHEYETASLSNIVSKLDLAKGSFYRYFESKKTLYLFLLEHCIEVRLKNDEKIIGPDAMDFPEAMVRQFAAKIQYDKKYPMHSAFLYNVMQEKNNDELGNIQLDIKKKIITMIKAKIKPWIRNEQITGDIHIDTISFLILQTQLSIFDYIAIKYDIDFRKNIREKKVLYDLPEKDLLLISKQFVGLLQNGISVNKKTWK
jgi:TetR/AcrR family transcriptional regulator